MTSKITAPVPGLNGLGVGGLQFVDSVAQTDNISIIAYCREAGYTVEDVDAEPAFPEGDPSVDWKGDQLKAYADAKSVDLTGKTAPDPVRPADDAEVWDWTAYALALGLEQDMLDGKTAAEIRQFIDDLTELAQGQA